MLAAYEGAKLPPHIIAKWSEIANEAGRKGDKVTHEKYRNWLSMVGF